MAVFSVNQNRQLYVAEDFVDWKDGKEVTHKAGDLGVVVHAGKDGCVGKEIHFMYKGPDTAMKSDRIQVKNLDYVKAIAKEKLREPFRSQIVTLDEDVNGGELVSGQDYILRIVLRQFYGMSDEDVYFKEGAVHATAKMSVDDFYQKMVDSLNLCFSREINSNKAFNPYLKFEVATESVKDGETTKQVKGIKITEREQPWTLGTETKEHVLFEAVPTTVYIKEDNNDVIWGKAYDATPDRKDVVVGGENATGIGDGTRMADLEYFAMGERGDQYRMIGFPNYIPTTYMVNPNEEYDVLEIHHAFTDDGVNSYRSEKDITIISKKAGVIDQIVEKINEATGLEIAGTSGVATKKTPQAQEGSGQTGE